MNKGLTEHREAYKYDFYMFQVMWESACQYATKLSFNTS